MMKESVFNELQLLISMYNSSQIRFDDSEIPLLLENNYDEVKGLLNSSCSFTVKLEDVGTMENMGTELNFRIPVDYPSENVSVSCSIGKLASSDVRRSDGLTKKLNEELLEFTKNAGDSHTDLLSIIDRFKELFERYVPLLTHNLNENDVTSLNNCSKDVMCRIWIYSHHIYNKHKRKFLVDTARELNLYGFSMPGKPGFVCIEGNEADCDEYWSRTRQLTWQKISLIEKQMNVTPVFSDKNFVELQLTKSDFIRYLEEEDISTVIKQYMGI